MKHSWKWILPMVVLGLAIGLRVGQGDAQQKNVVVATKVAAAPALDGTLDAAWKAAQPLTVKAVGGRNLPGGSTEVSLRAVYSGDTVYFLMQYKDETDSVRRSPWQKQADGSWKQLKDPSDKGGDNNLYYEDKWAMIWNISSPAFEQKGCFAACHTGEGKPFGNKYLPNPGERADIWHMKGVRTGTVGQFDDQYLDATRYDKDKAPPPYWIVDAEKEAFDDSKYKAGDEVPGIIVAPFTGDRGDIGAKVSWKDGVRTVVFWRKLVTGSEYDVQFSDMKKPYAFGVAVFDNAQVRHAFTPGVLKMTFE